VWSSLDQAARPEAYCGEPGVARRVSLKALQETLRHTSIVLTADTYASVLPESAREAAATPPNTKDARPEERLLGPERDKDVDADLVTAHGLFSRSTGRVSCRWGARRCC
jgi:hypothetical protein